MSLYRPGTTPTGPPVSKPSWPVLDTLLTAPLALERERRPLRFGEAVREEPDRLLQDAHLQAARLLQAAAAESETALAQARQQGYEQGEQEGLAAARAQMAGFQQQAEAEIERARGQAELIRQAAESDARALRAEAESAAHGLLSQARAESAELMAQARRQQQQMLADAQASLVDLAVASAVRLVQGQLAIRPASVVAMVAAGLKRLRDTDCTVRVSPQDLPLLEAQRSTLERELGSGLLKLAHDPSLHQGSYVVSSPHGQVDAQMEQQAVQLRSALTAALGGE